MQLVLDLWDWSSEAAVAVSRTSQAAVIESVDRAMHLPLTGSNARSAVYAACDDVVTRYLEEPSLLAERPYSLFNELSALHQQFVTAAHRRGRLGKAAPRGGWQPRKRGTPAPGTQRDGGRRLRRGPSEQTRSSRAARRREVGLTVAQELPRCAARPNEARAAADFPGRGQAGVNDGLRSRCSAIAFSAWWQATC